MPVETNKPNTPNHIAIIMDGNGRWAKQNGKARVFGHKNGVKSVRSVTEGAAKAGVKYLTLYAFSTENWNRPKAEVTALMQLLVTTIGNETKTLNKNNIRLKAIGNLKSLPGNCYGELQNSIDNTAQNDGMTLVLALSYSSRWEIVDAAKKLLNDVKQDRIKVEDVSENVFNSYLCTHDIPDPDLLIRTSGEYRISNFLLWQLAYSELYFTHKLWPDFREEDLLEAIENYKKEKEDLVKPANNYLRNKALMNKFSLKSIIVLFLLLAAAQLTTAQITVDPALEVLDYSSPRTYEIGGITVSGTENLDHSALIAISGLHIGQEIKVPGDKITDAIKKLWNQDLFIDISLSATEVKGDIIFLKINVEERNRLSKFRFTGVKKGKQESLREDIRLIRGRVITPNMLDQTKATVRDYYVDKGYFNTEVNIIMEDDSMLKNSSIITIDVDKKQRVKIKDILIEGNEVLSDVQIRKAMKNTKRKKFIRIFKASKFIRDDYRDDLKNIIAKYNSQGYRDARISSDTVYQVSKNRVMIELEVKEGKQYYFGNIRWIGNTKFTDEQLNRILNIKRGDVFNQELFDKRLYQDPNGRDISSLYLDDGYLFFQPNVVEVEVREDTIDFEIRLREGQQARIDEVTISGNTKTNDHVIRREIRTYPGELFSRADLIRSQRELMQLGYFNQEKLGVNPIPDQADGTVDIEYVVEEQPSDQVELSGGWGGGRVVGSLGLSFNNFSARKFFKKEAWRPLPSGDGQRLSLRAQTNGTFFQSYNISFTEPWVGGRKPNSLSVTGYYSQQTNGVEKFVRNSEGDRIINPNRQFLGIWGLSVGLGRRLSRPDDFFQLYNEISYQYYELQNWGNFIFNSGFAHNLSFKTTFSRNSVDAPIYPRTGSNISLSAQITPPYSIFDNREDYEGLSNQERYKLIEFHKWKFNSSFFTPLAGKLVLNTKIGYGYLGSYNNELGQSPFERFYLGGDGLSGFNLDGSEIIALRGYGDRILSPRVGATIVSKYTMEVRYPFSLNPSATIYGLAFAEAGNSWFDFSEFSPFAVKRAAGVGVRIYMPFFGLLGLDWGYRFDDVPGRTDPNQRTEFHFTIGGNIGGW